MKLNKYIMLLFANIVYSFAVNSASAVSAKGVYQPKEPESLKKIIIE